jgi:hypothetical protein
MTGKAKKERAERLTFLRNYGHAEQLSDGRIAKMHWHAGDVVTVDKSLAVPFENDKISADFAALLKAYNIVK